MRTGSWIACRGSLVCLLREFKPSAVAGVRYASSPSSKRWVGRQGRDQFTREAKLQGLKSRAAFKLLQIDYEHHIFKKGQTVVDLGFAPGSWSQVAVDRTRPGGRVLGIDILPCAPPKGASAIQGDFLHSQTHERVKQFLQDPDLGRPVERDVIDPETGALRSYIDLERQGSHVPRPTGTEESAANAETGTGAITSTVDVVLSDMLMNTTGLSVRDHGLSMDLCHAALAFGLDTLKPGGHFICKFYMGSEDKLLEKCLRRSFDIVKREKPEASRKDSKEQYFVAKHKKKAVTKQDIYGAMYDY